MCYQFSEWSDFLSEYEPKQAVQQYNNNGRYLWPNNGQPSSQAQTKDLAKWGEIISLGVWTCLFTIYKYETFNLLIKALDKESVETIERL